MRKDIRTGLVPNLVKSARMIIVIYTGYIISGTLLYIYFGMNWFDALNHSIAALSTGGFSTKAESIGYYGSLGIEAVTIVLMLLGSTNFLAHLYLIRGGGKNFFRYCEVKFQLILCALAAPVLSAFFIYGGLEGHVGQGFRDGLFQVVTALTTTGFQTVPSFAVWRQSSYHGDDTADADWRRHGLYGRGDQTNPCLYNAEKPLLEYPI